MMMLLLLLFGAEDYGPVFEELERQRPAAINTIERRVQRLARSITSAPKQDRAELSNRLAELRKLLNDLKAKKTVFPAPFSSNDLRPGQIGTMDTSNTFEADRHGVNHNQAKILQILKPTVARIRMSGQEVILKEFDFKPYVDGDLLPNDGTYAITGTESYTTVLGAKRTLLVVQPLDIRIIQDAYKEKR